jgi:hypothetical protein
MTEARDYIHSSGDLTGTQWKGLRDLYGDLASRFPFAGDEKAPVVEEKDLRALLGGKSGYARVFADASQSISLSPEARQWVNDMAELSRILYAEGQDEPQPLHLKIEVGDVTFYPDDYKESYRIDELLVYMGGGLDFKWKPGEPKITKLDVPLFGKDASEESVVKVTPGERKGAMGRAFSKENWNKGVPQDLAPRKGAWAPLKLIMAGLPPGSAATGSDRLSLLYTAEVPYKKNDPGKIKIGITVEGKGLGRLLVLLKDGMKTPPASLGGNQ